MMNKYLQKQNELSSLRRDFKRELSKELAKIGFYAFSRVIVQSGSVEIRSNRLMDETQIKHLEEKFGMRLTQDEYRDINNIDEPFNYFSIPQERCEWYIYTFRGV